MLIMIFFHAIGVYLNYCLCRFYLFAFL